MNVMNTPITTATMPVSPPCPNPDPTFQTRLSARWHPSTAEIVPKVRQYIVQNWPWSSEESKRRYLTGNAEDGVMYAFPGVKNDRIEAVTTWLALHFLIDDYILESVSDSAASGLDPGKKKEAIQRLFGIMRRLVRPNVNNPVEVMVDHVASSFLSCSSEDEVAQRHARQILESTIQFITAAENGDGKATAMGDLNSYLAYRMVEAGVFLSLDLAFWGGEIYIPSHISNDPQIRSFFKLVSDHLVLVNDIYSYKVEQDRSEGVGGAFNAVSVLMRSKHVDAQDAMGIIKTQLTTLEEATLEEAAVLRDRYAEKGEEEEVVDKMIQTILEMMAGNCEWSKFCGRYNSSPVSDEASVGTDRALEQGTTSLS
uniref:Terpene synthase n=1 Tax=Clitopilus sp. TaxID=1967123 RepID=A0A4P2VS31_9AGAR|nr:putative sesquiterpene synthase [Clitopilus sp.]